MPDEFVKGQRWMSEAEPEMGLGLVIECEFRRVQVLFPSTGETRTYSSENAPLKRVQFQVGDKIDTHEGRSLVIDAIQKADGIYQYECAGELVPEMHLADTIKLGSADRRLLDGRVDSIHLFDLRLKAWQNQSEVHRHPAFGYMGARMDLIPHQLYIAREVASRAIPRVLLADEVGLGKTIEACLILHRLMVTGRAGRALILVPEPLVHQWFVELLRRFNLTCAIYDEERCASIQGENSGENVNPFLEEHLILTSLELFRDQPERLQQALAADWGMVIVDEVHHLKWEPEEVSWEYQVVEAFSRITKGLLLLTGTPEQFGEAGHFARLRLLDPDRFHDYQQFCRETEGYHETAQAVDKLILGEKPDAGDVRTVRALFDGIPRLDSAVDEYTTGQSSVETRVELVNDLLDRHGTGRVVFRNTRSTISGFPQRKVHGIPLRAAQTINDETDYAALAEAEMRYELREKDHGEEERQVLPLIGQKDPRIDWLVKFLKQNKDEKVLLICRYRERAIAIHEALLQRLNLKMTVFHEDLTLLQRDRNAAWFAEPDGARLLVCSEIGSEGRNFQFAHHLVLFDLPVDPELLEQRIGRLDRIGQKSEIQLHVPYFKGSGGEVLFQWFHHGIDAFEHSVQGGSLFLEKFGGELKQLLLEPKGKASSASIKSLLEETAGFREGLRRRLEQGRDRLLELHSFRPEPAERLIAAIREWDEAAALELFMSEALDHFGVHIEELGSKRWLLTKGHLLNDELAVIPDEGKMVTLDRHHALERDDVEFLTWDHPLTASVLDFLLCSETGNAAFAEVTAAGDVERGLYAELVYILEGTCPPEFDIKRFLPTMPIPVACNQNGEILDKEVSRQLGKLPRKDAALHVLSGNTEVLKALLQPIKSSAEHEAQLMADAKKTAALKQAHEFFAQEQERLHELRQRNGLVSDDELRLMEQEGLALVEAIKSSQLRLDAVCLYRAS